MDLESARDFCLSLPHATENVQWDDDLVFKIGGRMFAVMGLDSSGHKLSFRVSPEEFAELTERDRIDPAPYAARYFWIALKRFDALQDAEVQRLIRNSYNMAFNKLPKKVKAGLSK